MRDERAAIRVELAAALFDNLTPIMIMAAAFLVIGAIIAGPLRNSILDTLYAAGVLSGVFRVAVVLAYRATSQSGPASGARMRAWERAYAAGSYTFATILGAFSAFGVLIGTSHTDILVVTLLFGWGSGVVARVSLRPWISIPSVQIASLPGAAAFAYGGSTEHIAVAAALAGFAIGSIESVAKIHRAVLDQFSMRRDLVDLARRDPLTGLGNRLFFEETLAHAIGEIRSGSCSLALHYIDLDGFKPVNDALGHAAGDTLLRAVAGRLREHVRGGDVASRLGGDEFVVVQRCSGGSGEAELLARRIVRALGQPFSIDGREVRISASVGVATTDSEDTHPQTLLREADDALYRAKRVRNGFVLSRPTDGATAVAS